MGQNSLIYINIEDEFDNALSRLNQYTVKPQSTDYGAQIYRVPQFT